MMLRFGTTVEICLNFIEGVSAHREALLGNESSSLAPHLPVEAASNGDDAAFSIKREENLCTTSKFISEYCQTNAQ